MKKIILSIVCLCAIGSFFSCSNDDNGPAPAPLAANTITYDKIPGAIIIRWNKPAEPTYKYIKITYQVPGEDKPRLRLASAYADSIKIYCCPVKTNRKFCISLSIGIVAV